MINLIVLNIRYHLAVIELGTTYVSKLSLFITFKVASAALGLPTIQ